MFQHWLLEMKGRNVSVRGTDANLVTLVTCPKCWEMIPWGSVVSMDTHTHTHTPAVHTCCARLLIFDQQDKVFRSDVHVCVCVCVFVCLDVCVYVLLIKSLKASHCQI